MSTFLSWTSPSCIEKSRVPFPSFGYREREYDFASWQFCTRETRGVPTEACEHFGAKAAAGA